MTHAFDPDALNHVIAATDQEMSSASGKRHAEGNTLFMGGPRPTEADLNALARFGLAKNWNVVFPFFGSDADAGPIGFHAVVTDGVTQSITLADGRLWKRDRRTPAVLLFHDDGALLKLDAKRRLVLRGIVGRHAEDGYGLALAAVQARALRKPGRMPVVSVIGGLTTVTDMRTLADTFAAAA